MSQEYNIEVGKRLFKERTSKGLTRAEIGLLVSLHESTVKRYEDGDIKSLSIEKIEHFAKALNTSAAYLMGWEDKQDDIQTIAAHHEGDEWTDEELDEIEAFKQFVRSKRKQ